MGSHLMPKYGVMTPLAGVQPPLPWHFMCRNVQACNVGVGVGVGNEANFRFPACR